jgi:cytochrome c-type biogenesis protein CcsB
MNFLVFIVSLLLYLVATVLFGLGLFFKWARATKTGRVLFVGGFLSHLLFTALRYVEAGYPPVTNLFESLSFFCLATAACFLYLSRRFGLLYVSFFVSAAIFLILGFSSFLPREIGPLPPVLRSFWLPIHTIFAFLGNAIFFIAFVVSLLYVLFERKIKGKRPSFLATEMPALETLDLINYRCLAVGFLMLTTGIVTGSIWASFAWGSYWNWDPKETWSLITWIVYAIIIHNRLRVGWRGKKTAYMMILGFLCVLVTFLGVNLLIGGLHSYV